ncbi:hypothetical protein C7S18_17305 [Ahniella affigens]|uniref:Blue (type 1) copper domain-containing protein n=1 Tax=Ahniella affigens TaxID=2021234 RepID=A0A2P1PVI0_9GAMM|nr:plastocyanin/azurin family copper-binding protein [Ahniella affigens]AVP98830.1 hypothetical protein C7S18_17305 [Ahniella affigens]
MNQPVASEPCSLPLRQIVPLSLRLLLLGCLLLSLSAHATTWIVQVGGAGQAYNPQFLTIEPGDRVRFANIGGFHNVVADNGAFRCARGCDGDGQNGNGNATAQLWTATVQFPTAGQFGYFCEPHGAPGQGMFGAITVRGLPPRPVAAGGIGSALALALIVFWVALIRLRARG